MYLGQYSINPLSYTPTPGFSLEIYYEVAHVRIRIIPTIFYFCGNSITLFLTFSVHRNPFVKYPNNVNFRGKNTAFFSIFSAHRYPFV